MSESTEEKEIFLKVPGFANITTSNIVAYQKKMEKFLEDKKFAWFLADTLGMSTSWKKGEKFEKFIGAMEDNEHNANCLKLKELAIEIAEVNPLAIIFESGSAAERDFGKSIDKKIAKDLKIAAVKEAIECGVCL